jgi:Fe-S cluster biogenesis protein NfuA
MTNKKQKENAEERIEKILAQVRPYIQMHGGDVYLQSLKNGVLTLKISGACAHCSLSDITYNKMIGGIIREEVPEIKDLIIEN